MNKIYNSKQEVAIQCLLTLNCNNKKSLTLDRLWLETFLTINAKDFGISEKNLYGDSIYNNAQLTSRYKSVKESILLLISKELIIHDRHSENLAFTITPKGVTFCAALTSHFSKKYIQAADKVNTIFKEKTDLELLYYINQVLLKKE
ncbi:hypothetical protein QE611_04045 [Streptococcus suis]|uniref:ABC-three component system middle component 2 n=1 Tax=Streptococcus suis TaxID=1307 RepID=UPI003705B6F1